MGVFAYVESGMDFAVAFICLVETEHRKQRNPVHLKIRESWVGKLSHRFRAVFIQVQFLLLA